MPFARGIIAHPGRHRAAALEIRAGSHHQQLHRRIEHAAFARGGEGNGLENVALHEFQPEVIGPAEIEVHLPTPVGLVQTQHLRGLFLALGRDHPPRVEPVAVGGEEFSAMRGEMHDLRATDPLALGIEVARIKALPPLGRRGHGSQCEAAKDEGANDHAESVALACHRGKGISWAGSDEVELVSPAKIRYPSGMRFIFLLFTSATWVVGALPNVVLVMADDQGWGQTGYYNHPVLKTPHLDAMAKAGLRFDRFYAGGPVCSPTRATVLTGRTHDRTGVFDHGYALRKQEKPLAVAMKKAGYATGHFGKWHLNGLRGPGVPIFGNDSHGPGGFGFDEWVSVTNFFDREPLMSRNGKFEDFMGDSSEIVVDEALKFIGAKVKAKKPFFAVLWYGTPH